MGDKIYIDTELLRQISSQLSQVHHSLSAVHQKLGGSVSEVRGVVSDQVGLINVLSSVQGNTQKAADYTERLAKAVNNAAARWEEVERRLANQQIQGSEAAPQGTGGGAGTGAATWMDAHKATWMGAMIGTALGGPFGIGIGMGIGAAIDADIFPHGFGEKSASQFLDKKNGGFFVKDGFVNTSLKGKTQIGWEEIEHKEGDGWDQNSGSIGVSAGAAAEANLYQIEYGYRGKYGELTKKDTIAGAAVSGDVAATLFTKDGKFDPQVYARAKGEAFVAKSEISGKLGTEDLNLYGGAEVTVLGAEGEVKAGYYRDEDGTKKWGAKVGGEAYYIKGEVKGGVDLYGIKIGVSGEGMVGVNASAGAEVGTGSASGEIGLGPIKGKFNVDWSDFVNKNFLNKP